MFGLERPGNECREAPRFVLEGAELLEMIDAMTNGLTNSGHHRAGGTQAEFVSFAVNHKPFFAAALQGTDVVSHFVIQNFAAAARHGVQTCRFQPLEGLSDCQFGNPRDIQNLGWREAMAVNRVTRLNSRQEILVIIDLQIRMNAALHQDTGATESDRFFDLFVDHMIRKNVSLRVALYPVERTERAKLLADIGVVDVAIDDIADDIIRMPADSDAVSRFSQIEQVRVFEEQDRLIGCHTGSLD